LKILYIQALEEVENHWWEETGMKNTIGGLKLCSSILQGRVIRMEKHRLSARY
jgi:hypothetical protein